MGATRPYLLIYKGKKHIIEAANAALAVHHVVGADISELRPARAAEVTQWMREKNEIPVADGKRVDVAGVVESTPGVEAKPDPANDLIVAKNGSDADRALLWFEMAAGFDRTDEANTTSAAETVGVFARMHPRGVLDLMTFDVLRQRVPAFGELLVAGTVSNTVDALRARLEEQPMTFDAVVKAMTAGIELEQTVAG
jgi:hypothetical protein